MAKKTDYPIYSVCAIKEGYFCVAGGGGAARTGVPNALELYELSHDGVQFQSTLKHRHTFEKELIMNVARCPQTFFDTIAASIDTSCYLFSLKKTEADGTDRAAENIDSAKEDNRPEPSCAEESNYGVTTVASKKTVYGDSKDAQQKVVKFSPSGYHVITGGTDGVVRMWKYPLVVLEQEFKGEDGSLDEITDLDYHPSEPMLVSVHRDGSAILWSVETGKQSFKWTWSPNRTAYRFRACSFLPTKKEKELLLCSINIPCKWKGTEPSYLLKWDVGNEKPIRVKKIGRELLTALAVSPSGDCLGVGSSEGSVAIYNADLQLLTRADGIHSTFVTAVTFVPLIKTKVREHQQPSTLALVSVSADRSYYAMLPHDSKDKRVLWLFILLPIMVIIIAALTYLFIK